MFKINKNKTYKQNLVFVLGMLVMVIFSIPDIVAQNQKDWNSLSRNWDINECLIPSKENKNITTPWTITRVDQNEESIWNELSCDFMLTTTTQKFGILLNIKNKDDYQLLRICNSVTNPVLQMLRWQYGKFRLWQEIKLPNQLSSEITYNLLLRRAPMVDKEDWRQWKIILTDNSAKQIILKQGIENEQPAFGVGTVGLYSETSDIRFCNFVITSKKTLTTSKALRFPPIFSDGMVLQQQTKIKIWGKANANEKIRIEIAEKSYNTISNKTSDWEIIIPPLKAQTELTIKVFSENDSLIINNVAVGEVWLASGQSNMEMRVWQTDVAEIANELLNDSDLRFFLQPQWPSPQPCFNSGGEWVKADSVSIMGWSAVALSYAFELRKKLQVPIGIISSNWGGTAAESWIPQSMLSTDSITSPILERVNQYQIDLEKGNPIENRYPWSWDVPGQRHTPGYLFNGMVAPHIPFSLKGVIWYQGESNSLRAKQYEHLFPMLISSWREKWQNPNMNFYFVQLSAYDGKQSGSEIEDAWPHLREAQRLTLNKMNNTGMAVSIDLGEKMNIHPYRKREIGIRLSKLALHDTYGFKNIIRSGPLYYNATFNSDHSIIHFTETGTGLKVLNGEILKKFLIAGEDRHFFPATAIILTDGKSIKIFSKEVKKPVAVRYAWENYPEKVNLGNSANLPASPFRTDDYKLELERK